ncbi:FAD-dependent oxidoreductase [Peribacillus sp. NPDC097264]|uniref:FAD-dependent oxidoreductase n=1 Tax=unclassified Peribacillus TaxID=2675266 RepID=UPI0037FE8A90
MYEIAIIGAGPAGGSAAIFTAKAGKKTVILDSNASITKKAWMENHYGVDEISGPDLVHIGIQQAKKFGAEHIETKVTGIEKTEQGFTIETENGPIDATYIILATGMITNLAEEAGVTTKDGIEPRTKKVYDVDSLGKTSVEGIWAAGAGAGVSVHTIVTAGDGARVAINLLSEINGERYVDHDVLKK